MPHSDHGCLKVNQKLFHDSRGFFTEIWNDTKAPAGFPAIRQINVSTSKAGTVRGLHFNTKHPQAKALTVLNGALWDTVIDLRWGSPDYGKVQDYQLQGPGETLYIPAGFAHGFVALEDDTLIMYGCSDVYTPEFDVGISPLDRQFSFIWNSLTMLGQDITISDKDRAWKMYDLDVVHFQFDKTNRFGCRLPGSNEGVERA